MLRRLKVRGRLMVVIAVPLVLLLVVAGPEVRNRWERATAADEVVELSRAAVDVANVVDALQRERVLSAALRAGATEPTSRAVSDLRTSTDSTTERAIAALERIAVGAPDLADATQRAAQELGRLATVRSETDAAASIVPWVDPFGPLAESLLAVLDGVGTVAAQAGAGDDLTRAGLVGRAKEAATAQAAQVAAATVWEELRGDQQRILATLRSDELAFRTAYLAATPADLLVERRAEVQQAAVTTGDRLVDELVDDGDVDVAGGLLRWLDTSNRRQSALRDVEAARAADALDSAAVLGDESRRASTAYAALAGGGLLVALALALLAARSITRPLRRLTDAADELAEERLPRLVDALRHPVEDDERYLSVALDPIPVRSDDELAHLGRAFNAVQAVAVDVAAQQADLLRKGISDLYVNLARRNQSLIERQIELLDRLESGEEDPEVLEHLYLLDHLATRMRRNAESLLVLAGAESGGRRARAIDVVDVVRAALSEVEAYERIELGELGAAVLHGPAVSDVAHLVAELLENATSFSPPSTLVRVDGARLGGSYQLVITDEGVGMPAEQLDEINAVLRDPPVTGLALGRSLGCLVAARLAARHGITVRLRAVEAGGTSAVVVLPRDLLAVGEAPAELAGPAGPVVPTGGQAARLDDALPSAVAFDAGLHALLDDDEPAVLVEPSLEESTGHDLTGPDRGEVAPLAGRVEPPSPEPSASRAPGGREALARRVPGTHAGALEPHLAPRRGRRSPEEVREILMRYRSGLRAGRAAVPEREEGS